jgi:hypothetical protein
LTGNRRGTFAARTGDKRLGGRRSSGVQDLLVSLRIAARTGVGTREMLRRLSLLVVSMDDRGKIIDGDVNAGVRDSSKCRGVVVWLMTFGREEGNMGGRGYVKGRRCGGGRSSATSKRTGSQTKEDMWLGRMGRKRDVFCADSVTAVESDRSCQCRVGRTERTAEEREDERGHNMRGRGGRQEYMLNSSITVNVGDLVHRVIINRSDVGAGQGQQAYDERRQERERDQDRASIWEEEIVDRQPLLQCLSTTQSPVSSSPPSAPPAPSPHRPLPTGHPRSNPLPPGQAVLVFSRPRPSFRQIPGSHISQPVKSGSERMQTLKSYKISCSSRAFNSLQ